jgi:hypothetical protein
MPKVNRLHTRLLVQCITDAKLNGLETYHATLQAPDSYIRVMLLSVATVMDRELKNLAKRMNRKIDEHVDSRNIPLGRGH